MEKRVVQYRAAIRDEERIIMSFKRELSLIVETISTPEESAKDSIILARRYLAIETAEEKKEKKKLRQKLKKLKESGELGLMGETGGSSGMGEAGEGGIGGSPCG